MQPRMQFRGFFYFKAHKTDRNKTIQNLDMSKNRYTLISLLELVSQRLRKIKKEKLMKKINNAKVVKADILTSNGVIHVIDTVVLPKKK